MWVIEKGGGNVYFFCSPLSVSQTIPMHAQILPLPSPLSLPPQNRMLRTLYMLSNYDTIKTWLSAVVACVFCCCCWQLGCCLSICFTKWWCTCVCLKDISEWPAIVRKTCCCVLVNVKVPVSFFVFVCQFICVFQPFTLYLSWKHVGIGEGLSARKKKA